MGTRHTGVYEVQEREEIQKVQAAEATKRKTKKRKIRKAIPEPIWISCKLRPEEGRGNQKKDDLGVHRKSDKAEQLVRPSILARNRTSGPGSPLFRHGGDPRTVVVGVWRKDVIA